MLQTYTSILALAKPVPTGCPSLPIFTNAFLSVSTIESGTFRMMRLCQMVT